MRQLKHHEKRLLRKVNLLEWKSESNAREASVVRRYMTKREDYLSYNRTCGKIRHLAHSLSLLPPRDPYRHKQEDLLINKLYEMGVITSDRKLSDCEKVTVSAFCRRRLPIVLMRLRMCETLTAAITYVETGQIRVGPETVTDPAFLVTRNMQDFVTWTDSSKIRRHVAAYNDRLDDYDLL